MGLAQIMRITEHMALIALMCMASACHRNDKGTPMADTSDMLVSNGFVLGDDREPSKPFIAGVGDGISKLVQRNPYLGALNLAEDQPQRLPLLQKLDATYDDGDLKFKVGCAFTSSVDGNERFHGVAKVGFKLCDPAMNDWKTATRRATELIKRFERENPGVVNLGKFLKTASDESLLSTVPFHLSQQQLHSRRPLHMAFQAYLKAGNYLDIVSVLELCMPVQNDWQRRNAILFVLQVVH